MDIIRKCRYCNEIKPLEEFANAGVINGKKYWRWRCKECYLKIF